MAVEIVAVDETLLASLPDFWQSIPGVGLNDRDDTLPGLRRFLCRNPGLCFAARSENGQLAGTLLCGWDGRRARLYHVCVHPAFRGRGIARRMVARALQQLKELGVVKCDLVCFADNEIGNTFWQHLGWVRRDDLLYWQMPLLSTRSDVPVQTGSREESP